MRRTNIKTELLRWLNTLNWDTELTLTFANDISLRQAEAALHQFWQAVDARLYGKAARRFGKRCQRLNFVEGDGVLSRYHFHIITLCPADRFDEVEDYCGFLRALWLEQNPNNFAVSCAPIRSQQGYARYLTKQVRSDSCDALVLDSSHISAAH